MTKPSHTELQKRFRELELKYEELGREDEQLRKEIFTLKSIIDSSPYSISLYDADGHYLHSNRAFEELFGALPPPGYSLFEDPVLKKQGIDKFFNSVRAGKVIKDPVELWYNPHELIPEMPDRVLYLRGVAFPIVTMNGTVNTIVIIHEDITDHKRAEDELRQTLKKLQNLESIINRSPAMVFLWQIREGWPVEYVSQNVVHVLGYTAVDFMSGKVSWPGITFAGDVPRLEAEVAKLLRNNVSQFQQEYRLIIQSGEVRWMRDRNTVLYNEEGIPTHIQSIVMDITELKNIEETLNQIEEALYRSEHKYKELVENISEVIFSLDLQGIVTYVSPTADTLLGYTPSEIVGKHFNKFVYHEDVPVAKERLGEITRGDIRTGEYRLVDRNGTIRWIQSSTKPFIKDTVPVGFQGILIDITERKRIEEQLRKARRELEIKSRNLEETNTALKVLLNHQNTERKNIERHLITSIKKLVIPYLKKIKNEVVDDRQKTYLEIIETNLSEIAKPFVSNLEGYYDSLTTTEIKIANLIRENKSTRDIAHLLGIAESTVFFHRRNIRKKLDLKNKETNLYSFLRSFDNP